MKRSPQNIAIIILIGWFCMNGVQSFFTELIHDEAYYWVFAQNLGWGYFDHPPMTAIMIWAGWGLFENEFGVRLMFILANTLSLWLIWKMTDQENPLLFFGLVFSAIVAHLGFMAVPDIPLLLFVSLFFYLAGKYLENDSWSLAVVLGVVVAAMGYSKYQGVIVLLFALLSNPHLLKRLSFWIIPVLGTLLLLPHFYWQWTNDFPTFRYHLYDRLSERYTFLHVVNYVSGQFLLFGPFVGLLFTWAVWRFKVTSDFDRMMKWSVLGVFGFFLIMSFRGRIEANWTVVSFVPLLYISYKVINPKELALQWVKRIGGMSILLLLIARVYLIIDFIPGNDLPRNEFHGWDTWAKNVSEIAGEMPVIFNNNYQKAAKYQFYSGEQAHSVNTVSYAGNQYDLLSGKEEALNGQTVMFISDWIGAKDTVFSPGQTPSPYKIISFFTYINRVKIKYEFPAIALKPDSVYTIDARLVNPTSKTVDFSIYNGSEKICYHWFEYRKPVLDGDALDRIPVSFLAPGEEIVLKLKVKMPKEPGEYRFRIAINLAGHHGRNSAFKTIVVNNDKN